MTVLSIGALLFSTGACSNNENPRYEVKQVNVRREANKVDKTIPIRFYQLTPFCSLRSSVLKNSLKYSPTPI